MFDLDSSLEKKLRDLNVGISSPDGDSALLRNVPVHPVAFSKEATNVLIKRPREGLPFLVCVDHDLNYRGDDSRLARAFARDDLKGGWRLLNLGPSLCGDLPSAVRNALAALGFDGGEPALEWTPRQEERTGLIHTLGLSLTALAREGRTEPTVGRDEEILTACGCVLGWTPARLALVTGESGVGKTNLAHGVAKRLLEKDGEIDVVLLCLEEALGGLPLDMEREEVVSSVLDEVAAKHRLILVLEHLESFLTIDQGLLLLSRFLDRGFGLMGTVLPDTFASFLTPPLARRIQGVPLTGLKPDETANVLRLRAKEAADHHGVSLGSESLTACVKASKTLAGPNPAKALALLDAAAARVSLEGGKVVGPDDVLFSAARMKDRFFMV